MEPLGVGDDNRPWDGKSWQEHIVQLLHIHHGPGEVQEVPDQELGDLGIECYCPAAGTVYQCNAPAQHIRGEALYEAHRDKITVDVKKFIDNKEKLAEVLGSTKVRRWVFVVPRLSNRKIVAHCKEKTKLVREAGLPYVADDFEVVIQNLAPFAVARAQLSFVALSALHIDPVIPTPDIVETWIQGNAGIVVVLDGKIAKISTLLSEDDKQSYRDDVVAGYLMGQDLFDQLQRDHKQTYERVMRVHTGFGRRLAKTSKHSPHPPEHLLVVVTREYRDSMAADNPQFAGSTLDTLAEGAIATFMVNCNLNFRAAKNG